jgi:2-polyprenyl-3-methyl-5-hydroxy-6-metoxy-1,4-benzoquinol methylase
MQTQSLRIRSTNVSNNPDAGFSSHAGAAAHWDTKYTEAVRSAWTKNSLVESELYVRMTGSTGHWLDWTFNSYLPPIERLLSIGCGDGSHELAIARHNFARHVTAFDASPVAIEQARAVARAENLNIDFQVSTFEAFTRDPSTEQFDAVLFCGSLHHVTEIEAMLFAVRRRLKPQAPIIVNEYVGPCYQLYDAHQLGVITRTLDSIPAEFKIAPDAALKLPTIEMIMGGDPTEGVRASLIRTLLPMFFDVGYERLIGGALLHPIFGLLDDRRINDGSPESRMLAQMLIAADRELTLNGVLQDEFLFAIYTNP